MAIGGDGCGGGGGDLYAVLGLTKECSDADLKVAYRKLAMRWRPDRCSSSSGTRHMEEAKEKFQEIQGAYSGLNLPSLKLHIRSLSQLCIRSHARLGSCPCRAHPPRERAQGQEARAWGGAHGDTRATAV